MRAKISRWGETELNPEHVPAKGSADNRRLLVIGPPLAVQEILLSAVAGTALEISECPRAPVAPEGVRSVVLRADRAVVQREPAANGVPPAWVHAAVEAVAAEAVAVAGGDKQP